MPVGFTLTTMHFSEINSNHLPEISVENLKQKHSYGALNLYYPQSGSELICHTFVESGDKRVSSLYAANSITTLCQQLSFLSYLKSPSSHNNKFQSVVLPQDFFVA